MKCLKSILLTFCSILVVSSCSGNEPVYYSVEVVAEYPHDTESYTQGLFFEDGVMYESTGLKGKSSFRCVDIPSGKALKRMDFDKRYFVEGSVILGDNLYILTWESRVIFIYDAATLEYRSTWKYPREGWGLTTDGKHLIASDGSSSIYFMDEKFDVKRKLNVTLSGRPVKYLNELEWIDGRIWANVYTTDQIVIISPKDGVVEGIVDCPGLMPRKLRSIETDVLNGIAYNPEDGKIYLTGKNWPRMYEVRLKKRK